MGRGKWGGGTVKTAKLLPRKPRKAAASQEAEPDDVEPEEWDITLTTPTGRLIDIFAEFSHGEGDGDRHRAAGAAGCDSRAGVTRCNTRPG